MAQTKKKDFYSIHLVIGIGIMLLFRFLPIQLPCITPIGMEILGIFIGTLYLWTTSDPIISSILSIFLVGLTGYSTMNEVLTATFGNPILVQVLFLLTAINCLIENNLTEYCGRFFLTRKICLGRPWVLAFFIMLGSMLMGAFMGGFTPIFLFCPILYDIFETVGLKKHDKFPTIMLILVTVATLLGFPIPPFMGNGLALISNYASVTGNMGAVIEINNAGYLLTGLIHATVCIIVLVLQVCTETGYQQAERIKDGNVKQESASANEPASEIHCSLLHRVHPDPFNSKRNSRSSGGTLRKSKYIRHRRFLRVPVMRDPDFKKTADGFLQHHEKILLEYLLPYRFRNPAGKCADQ